ncbi:MAG: sugar ABC transporter ATP-binding protein [Christensenellales bacterium]
METILELKNITKTFGKVKALSNVSIAVRKGEVHALVGGNGAGKSTLIKILTGALSPDSGEIILKGKKYNSLTPSESMNEGISVVYQELNQMESMTVADNIFVGIQKSGFINDKERTAQTEKILARFETNIRPTDIIGHLSIAQRQIVEITKAIFHKADLIIMDEPTSSITMKDQELLMNIIRGLQKDGVTIIYISHRLDELFKICDRATVLRDGQYIDTVEISKIDKNGLIRLMVGRELSETFPKTFGPSDEIVMRVDKLTGNGVKNITFELRKGEILGFAGLVGAGRTELMQVIFGAEKKENGSITLKGKEVNFRNVRDALASGIAMISEDRKQGCILRKPIFWNITLSCLRKLNESAFIDRKKEDIFTKKMIQKLSIKTPSVTNQVGNLSGGNQQKVVIGKALAVDPEILIFDEPTRGVDVGARYEIYSEIIELTKQGKSIIMVSSDMEELLGISDRIVILHEGKLAGIVEKNKFIQETVLRYASGEIV